MRQAAPQNMRITQRLPRSGLGEAGSAMASFGVTAGGGAMPGGIARYVAEVFGTAVLVLVGCGAVAIGTHGSGALAVNIIGIAFSFGLAVTAMAYAIGPISGCHI